MLKLCLIPNYKQVLGELSRPISTGSTPGHCAHCCAQGFFLVNQFKMNPEEKNHQVCAGKGIQHVFFDVLNSVIDFMMMKRCHMPTSLTCIEVMAHVRWGNAIKWRNITNAILYIGLMTWCHESLHLEKIPSWSRLKRAHYVSKPFNLLEITITFLLQLRKFW